MKDVKVKRKVPASKAKKVEEIVDKPVFQASVEEEFDTVPTEEEMKQIKLPGTLRLIQRLYHKGLNNEAEKLLAETLNYHFNIDVYGLRDKVAEYVRGNASDLASQVNYIVPDGNWSKCINDDEGKVNFLATEGGKSEGWGVKSLATTHLPKVWAVAFKMKGTESEDDGIIGYAYVSETGKVKHIFAQGE